jgi:hydrogenase nickel incorporation protein HypA/HybF
VHEVSIALGMVDELYRIARENNAGRISSVKLKIGKMSGIVTDSLTFAFDAIKLEHPLLSETEIVIVEVPLVYECNDCHVSFNAEDIYFPSCAGCGSRDLRLVSGEEQHIESVEITD